MSFIGVAGWCGVVVEESALLLQYYFDGLMPLTMCESKAKVKTEL